ncbi:MAG: CHASE2 domain-containing protein [Nitrospirae bacterium]|nr:CHASE2 domain-containing protein [Nitrospirota bacterium]
MRSDMTSQKKTTRGKAPKKALREIMPAAIALSAVLSLILTVIFWGGAFEELEDKILNRAMVKRSPIAISPDLITIDIDDEALKTVGRWPWPWNVHAGLVDLCTLYGTKTIAFVNVDLSKNGLATYGGEALEDLKKRIASLIGNKDSGGLSSLLPDSGEILAESLKRNGSAYVTVDFKVPDEQNTRKLSTIEAGSAAMALSEKALSAKERKKRFFFEQRDGIKEDGIKAVSGSFPAATSILLPGIEILESVRGAGFNSISIDNDGIVRKYPVLAYYPDKLYPSLPLKIAMGVMNATELAIKPGKSVELKGDSKNVVIPLDDGGRIFVNWAGPYEETFVHLPFNLAAQFMGYQKAREDLQDDASKGNLSSAVLDKLIQKLELSRYLTREKAQFLSKEVYIAAVVEQSVNDSGSSDTEILSSLGVGTNDLSVVNIVRQVRFNNALLAEYKKTGRMPSFDDTLKTSRYGDSEAKDSMLSDAYDIMSYHLGKGTIDFVHPLYFEHVSLPYKGKTLTLTPLFLKDKIVSYGLTATGLTAQHPTPFAKRHPMLDLVPNVLNTILTEQFLVKAPPWFKYVGVCALVLFVIISVLTFNPAGGGAMALALIVAYVSLSWLLLVKHGYLLPMAQFLAAMVTAYFSGVLYRYVRERKERSRVRGMFSTMVSPEVLRIIETNPDKLSLGGDKRESTMFSSDVSGFTTISEGVTSRELANILNIYLTPMSNIIMSYNGYVDKYEGDAIKADFGVPLSDPDQGWKACYAALYQQEELKVIQRMLFIRYGVRITARMGINTGIVYAGNMGSVNRMQYTVMGDAAAVAEELEPANKLFETWIMIGEATYRKAKDYIDTRFLCELALGHEEHPLQVYEVLGWKADAFVNYWSNRPIPELILEQFRKMQPEKVLAYEDYFQKKELADSEMAGYVRQTFSDLSILSVEYIKQSDVVNVIETQKSLTGLIHDFMSYKHVYEGTKLSSDVVAELEGLSDKIDSETRQWNRKLLQWREGLKSCAPYLPALKGKIDPTVYDRFLNETDVVEKNIERLYKRITSPDPTDHVGIELSEHIISILANEDLSSGYDVEKLMYQCNSIEKVIRGRLGKFVDGLKKRPKEFHDFVSGLCTTSENVKAILEPFDTGRKLFVEGKLSEAAHMFRKCLFTIPDDGPSLKYLEKIEELIHNPPDGKWSGVWTAG